MIDWPADLDPRASAIHVRNELETDLAPEQIWPWLVRPRRWPELYDNASDIRTPTPELALGTRFSWRTLGVSVTTEVEVLVPYEQLAWRGTGLLGAKGYHAWVLERRESGTRFITEETQRGIIPSLMHARLRRNLHAAHQRWLEGLVRAARTGPPEAA